MYKLFITDRPKKIPKKDDVFVVIPTKISDVSTVYHWQAKTQQKSLSFLWDILQKAQVCQPFITDKQKKQQKSLILSHISQNHDVCHTRQKRHKKKTQQKWQILCNILQNYPVLLYIQVLLFLEKVKIQQKRRKHNKKWIFLWGLARWVVSWLG